jgi:hypothetical protein
VCAGVDHGVAGPDVAPYEGREQLVVRAVGDELGHEAQVVARYEEAVAPRRRDEHATVPGVGAVHAGRRPGGRRIPRLELRLPLADAGA